MKNKEYDPQLCLGIETSCDETSLALVRNGKLLHMVTDSQVPIHTLFGGVVPEMASREHCKSIARLYDILLQESVEQRADTFPSTIAVTRGPGLLGSLLVGIGFAKGLAFATGVKIIGVNHLHAHLLAVGLEGTIQYPALGLLVSGGHTHLCSIKNSQDIEVLGKTLDDAAGEAFDKTAKFLGLAYPGGAIIDVLSKQGRPIPHIFTLPYIANDNLNFSFSGLKTAVSLWIQQNPQVIIDARIYREGGMASPLLCDLAASLVYTVAETLAVKMQRALDQLQQQHFKTVILAGGVAACAGIRSRIKRVAEKNKLEFMVPRLNLCTDNAAMIAYMGDLLTQENLQHDLTFPAIPRGMNIPNDYCML